MPLITWCVRPLSARSMRRASAASRGLPRMRRPTTTIVSQPTTSRLQAGDPRRSATARSLSSAARFAKAAGSSPGRGVSSMSGTTTRKARPARASSSRRRGEPLARTRSNPAAPPRPCAAGREEPSPGRRGDAGIPDRRGDSRFADMRGRMRTRRPRVNREAAPMGAARATRRGIPFPGPLHNRPQRCHRGILARPPRRDGPTKRPRGPG